MPDLSLMKHPGAFVPVLMSLAALALVVGHALVYGIVHETDEGSTAHLFQILMAAQLPLIGWFALRSMRRHRSGTLCVLAIQLLAAVAAVLPVHWLT
ncbi:MAG TPA: hypothetical protein PKC03_01865 [Dokdonella sp.]|jgi:hypothetical protein|nr:hypothetical protein [Dokdonella sp.]